jgi:hypothetical protein
MSDHLIEGEKMDDIDIQVLKEAIEVLEDDAKLKDILGYYSRECIAHLKSIIKIKENK